MVKEPNSMNSQANIQFKKNKLASLQKQLEQLKNQYSALASCSVLKNNLPSFDNDKQLLEICQIKNKEHINNLRKYNALRDTGIHLVEIVADDKNNIQTSSKIVKKMDIIRELGYEDME